MKKILFAFTATSFLMIASIATVKAQTDTTITPTVVSPPPVAVPTNDIVGIAAGSLEHTMFVEAINTAGVLKTFQLNGPFTVFAPTNAAFEKIPAADRAKLMKNKKELGKLLKYHVVGGTWTSTTLMAAIKQGEGFIQLPTLSSHKLKATVEEGKIMLTDEMGNSFYVTNADIAASNGLVHIVDGVAHPAQQAVAKQ